ncbi:LysR family transcriptional regulator [Sporosarcina highlanderae]|uniref:LysR family transcriptional regulator n=1 Tax=Sporosarcina highlanderae TaxID=3035916 RepID=A0ABT8JME4_9BACL|nr:LysR family transcriptional regulator [Sporosarcina highlanderae]MDN4606244.1 LysR family transcriptional regulator [Sporosarcina highlanderae]
MDQQLQIFVTVAEKESFSRAAEEHHMTQPAVSQYIRQLEEEIGARLLERTNKYVRLNKAGEIVYHHAKEILALYTKMQSLVDDLANKASGPLSIGASYTFGEYVLPRIIANLKQTYPDIQPTVTIGNTATIADLVASHQLDIGIVEGKFNAGKLIVEDFAEDAMVIVSSADHPLARIERSLEVVDLEQETWIVREHGSGTREAMDKLFKQHGISPTNYMYFSSTQPIKESVEAGLGISLLSHWSLKKELKNGDLRMINVNGLPFPRKFSIVTNTPFQTKALEVFIDILRTNKLLTTLE